MLRSCFSKICQVTTCNDGLAVCRSHVLRSVSTGHVCKQSTSPLLQAQDAEIDISDPLQHPDFFDVRSLVSLKELFDARVHLGHKRGTREANMEPYIFGTRLECDILDLEKTVPLLQDALNFTAHIAFRGGVIMFLTRNLQMIPHVEDTAKEAGEYAHCREWTDGTFTNATVRFGAITRLPDLCIFLGLHDTVFQQHRAIVECSKMAIPAIGIADTNTDPGMVSHMVPGNDDSPHSLKLYCTLFKEAIMIAKDKRQEMQKQGLIEGLPT